MQADLKKQLQDQIDQQFKHLDKSNQDERVFLGQYQLPQSFHELTSGSDIPDSYMNKISEFQKKGGINNYKGILSGLDGLREQCGLMIQNAQQILQEEEGFDN